MNQGAPPKRGSEIRSRVEPQREMPEPLVVPPGEPVVPGEVVLPEEPAGSQSFNADFASAELPSLPSVLEVPLLLVLEPRLLLLAAEPFGAQSGLAIEPVVPDIEPGPDFGLVPAVPLLLVWAMAAPPKVNVRTETAVRRRRFIGSSVLLVMGPRAAVRLADTVALIAAFGGSFRSIR
jgi:hypothetical protein